MTPTAPNGSSAAGHADPLHGIDLHPLDRPPCGPAWNAEEIADLFEPECLRVQAAVLIGVVARPQGAQVLLTRRTENLSSHAGQVSFPGGRLEPTDAGPLAAALRETEEEVSIGRHWLQPLGFIDPYETITGFRILPVVSRLNPDYLAVPDPREVAEAFEVPLTFLLDPANCEHRQADYRGRMRHYCQFRYGDHLIWGATAAMLVNLRQRLTGV